MIKLPVRNCDLIEFPKISDSRGTLCFCESDRDDIHFEIQRVFWVFGTPENTVRGHHAHRDSRQIHICLNGSARITLEDGKTKTEVLLDSPDRGLIIGPMVWHSFILSPGAKLVVITSNYYDEGDYIRDYKEFLRLTT